MRRVRQHKKSLGHPLFLASLFVRAPYQLLSLKVRVLLHTAHEVVGTCARAPVTPSRLESKDATATDKSSRVAICSSNEARSSNAAKVKTLPGRFQILFFVVNLACRPHGLT